MMLDSSGDRQVDGDIACKALRQAAYQAAYDAGFVHPEAPGGQAAMSDKRNPALDIKGKTVTLQGPKATVTFEAANKEEARLYARLLSEATYKIAGISPQPTVKVGKHWRLERQGREVLNLWIKWYTSPRHPGITLWVVYPGARKCWQVTGKCTLPGHRNIKAAQRAKAALSAPTTAK